MGLDSPPAFELEDLPETADVVLRGSRREELVLRDEFAEHVRRRPCAASCSAISSSAARPASPPRDY